MGITSEIRLTLQILKLDFRLVSLKLIPLWGQIGARVKEGDMYTEKMGSAQRFSQPSYVGVNSWFNGLNPVKPR